MNLRRAVTCSTFNILSFLFCYNMQLLTFYNRLRCLRVNSVRISHQITLSQCSKLLSQLSIADQFHLSELWELRC